MSDTSTLTTAPSIEHSAMQRPESNSASASPMEAAKVAAKRVAPLWPLQDFVAVNPFLGVSGQSFQKACELYGSMVPGGMQMPLSYYADKLASGDIQEAHLEMAIFRTGNHDVAPDWVREFAHAGEDLSTHTIHTVAEAVDAVQGTEWERTVVDVISRFCASFYDGGQVSWKMPGRELGLYGAWKAYASDDHLVEIWGLKGFRKKVSQMSPDWTESLETSIQVLNISEDALVNVLHKELLSIRGWAGHVRYQNWHQELAGEESDALLQLLAIRLAYESALFDNYESNELAMWTSQDQKVSSTILGHYLLQLADEIAWEESLTKKLKSEGQKRVEATPQVQAVFCIDVRSEVFRRNLESLSSDIETLGFAGFFGMPIESIGFEVAKGTAQCPVLLTPQYRVPEVPAGKGEGEIHRMEQAQSRRLRLAHGWNAFKNSAISSFSFVEVAGLKYLPTLLRDAFASRSDSADACDGEPNLESGPGDSGISLEARVDLAEGALQNMGLQKDFARLVLFCGHGSETKNNPYAAGLDCGACGGHSGAPNAKVAAAILNQAEVRSALKDRGIEIPETTWFLAGLHNTTTDEVEIFGQQQVPESHQADLDQLEEWLKGAGERSRIERSTSLGLSPDPQVAHGKISQRALDWSQTRPEWGLAGNAAFIAAPRQRTQGLDLGGRAFLHNYDWTQDADNTVLTLIMSAPMVVANWINLQYYASTVNNPVFGSGNKVIHNVCGTMGVCLGNGGDLQTGLPLQSVHDGKRWMHEPLRLHVFLEAPQERIDAVLEQNENVRELVENEWLILFSIENEGQTVSRRVSNNTWVAS